MLFAKYLVNNSDIAFNRIPDFLRSLFYRKVIYTSNQPSSYESYVNSRFNKMFSSGQYNTFKLKIDVSPMKTVVEKLRIAPPPISYKNILLEAKKEHEDRQEGVAVFTQIIYDPKKKQLVTEINEPITLFPSRNYRKMKKIVNRQITYSEDMKIFKIVPIYINGEPGLGKSYTGDFLSRGTKLSHIRYVDLQQFINFNLEVGEVLYQIFHGLEIRGHTLIIIDEIDKFTNGYILNNPDVDVGSLNRSILNEINTMINSRIKTMNCVFIVFCSNNFDTIYENVDMGHYASLQSRLTAITYNRLDKKELGQYFEWVLQRKKSLHKKENIVGINNCLSSLSDDFSIPFRDLFNISVKCHHRLDKICESLRVYVPPTHLSPSKIVREVKLPQIKEKAEINTKIIVNKEKQQVCESKSNVKEESQPKPKNNVQANSLCFEDNSLKEQLELILGPNNINVKSIYDAINNNTSEIYLDILTVLLDRLDFSKENAVTIINSKDQQITYSLNYLTINSAILLNKCLEQIKNILIHKVNHQHFIDCLYFGFCEEDDHEIREHLEILIYFKDYKNIIKEDGGRYVQKLISLYNNDSRDPQIITDYFETLEFFGKGTLKKLYDNVSDLYWCELEECNSILSEIISSKYFGYYNIRLYIGEEKIAAFDENIYHQLITNPKVEIIHSKRTYVENKGGILSKN